MEKREEKNKGGKGGGGGSKVRLYSPGLILIVIRYSPIHKTLLKSSLQML